MDLEELAMEDLAELIVTKLREQPRIDPTHREEHEFVRMLIQERQDKLARQARIRERIAGSVLLSIILGLLGLVGTLGSWGITYLKEHLK